MKISFTKHAQDKLAAFEGGKTKITATNIVSTLTEPDLVDATSRVSQRIAQKTLDQKHVLRVVYMIGVEKDAIKVITFYPGRKSQYEK